MAKKKAKGWIAGVVKGMDTGSFSAKAKKAGKSTKAYASEKKNAGGRLGKQANLALTFSKMRRKKGKKAIDYRGQRED